MSSSETGRSSRKPVRPLPFICAALLLGGCGTNSGAWSQYLELLRLSTRNTLGNQAITLEQAAAIPYATLGYRLDGGNEAILVLATDTNGDQLWTAASRIVLTTRDGRIMRSVGLPYDRSGYSNQTSTSLPPPSAALKSSFESWRLVDLPNLGIYATTIRCTTAARGRQLITILGTSMSTVRVDETCRGDNPRWSFTDSYWVNPDDGFVWRSLQHLHPRGSRVQIRILRPPG